MNENVLTLGDLIKKKDYDCISVRVTSPPDLTDYEPDMFFGICHSKGGVLFADDGDTYSENEEVLSYEEWDDLENEIQNGLTVILQGHWM